MVKNHLSAVLPNTRVHAPPLSYAIFPSRRPSAFLSLQRTYDGRLMVTVGQIPVGGRRNSGILRNTTKIPPSIMIFLCCKGMS